VQRSPSSGEALLAELGTAAGNNSSYDRGITELAAMLAAGPEPIAARSFSSLAARLFAAGLLIRQAPAAVADLYCATRLAWVGDRVFGELPGRSGTGDLRRLVETVTPEL
jgi:putative acyl-CoA dehydrogenase